jgi:hypothetical protein
VPHEAFYATAARVIPLFLILLVFQTREYRFGAVVVGMTVAVLIVAFKVSGARRESS